MTRQTVLGLAISMLFGCGGSKTAAEAGVVAAVAAGLQAAQLVQEKRRQNAGKTYECTTFCTYKEVPCGDECVPYGSTCYVAPRHACYGGAPEAPEEPMPRAMETAHPAADKDMGVIIFSPVE